MKRFLALLAFAAVALAACNKPGAPTGSETAAAMPDTSAPRAPDAQMTAPDAGATGVVPAAPPPGDSPKDTATTGEPPK